MFLRPPPAPSKLTWLWLAPYAAIGVFALAMLIVTGLLQWREQDTARSALEGDMHLSLIHIEMCIRDRHLGTTLLYSVVGGLVAAAATYYIFGRQLSAEAVSYTHLDVYKRQTRMSRASFSTANTTDATKGNRRSG